MVRNFCCKLREQIDFVFAAIEAVSFLSEKINPQTAFQEHGTTLSQSFDYNPSYFNNRRPEIKFNVSNFRIKQYYPTFSYLILIFMKKN